MKNQWIFPIITVILTIPLILPYFHSGYFPTHDGEWAVIRLGDMYRELKDLQIPARYSGQLNFTYGYPLFNFAYPFPYYLGSALLLFKLGLVNSIKILFAVSVPLSSLFMFLFSKDMWKNELSGAASGVLYAYLPYRFVDLYVRGSIGESLSFVLFPLILLAMNRFANTKKKTFSLILFSLSYALLITTHNITATLFTPVIVLFLFLISNKNGMLRKQLCLGFLLGIFLASFFWMPALFEKQYISLSRIPITDRNLYFVSIQSLLIPKWGYGTPTDHNGFSYQLGLPQLLLFLFVLVSLWRKRFFLNGSLLIPLTFIVVTIVMILMLFSFTAIIWKSVPFLSEINYPWILLAVIGFTMSFLAGFLMIQGKVLLYMTIAIVLIGSFFYLQYARPQYFVNRGNEFYLTNQATTTSSDEYMPLWVHKKPITAPSQKVLVVEGVGKIHGMTNTSKSLVFLSDMRSNGRLQINTIYYPGWKFLVDGQSAPIDFQNESGLMTIELPLGNHTVSGSFSETPFRLLSDSLTLLALSCLVIYSFLLRKQYAKG